MLCKYLIGVKVLPTDFNSGLPVEIITVMS